tara:strand:- start:1999 stop:2928 length:930 start_codon:yes stop_codon:yes gene_type:complete
MSLFQIEFNERELITLRIIFNSNSGLNRIIASTISLNEIRSLNQESIKKLKFRHSEDIMNKLQNYNSYESQAIDILEWCEDNNISVVSIFNENYPNRLRKIHNPPCLLFCAGDKNLLNIKKSIAIVGSRDAGNIGINVTEKTTSFFAKNNVNIVSGLAKGVDTQAHKTAIANNAPTTAILVDIKNISPANNINLAKKIINSGGLIVSENLPGTQASESYLFIDRNRIQTGLSKFVIIIEANPKSGTKYTAEHAYKQKKPIYCSDLSLIEDYPKALFETSLNKQLYQDGKAKLFSASSYEDMLKVLENDS